MIIERTIKVQNRICETCQSVYDLETVLPNCYICNKELCFICVDTFNKISYCEDCYKSIKKFIKVRKEELWQERKVIKDAN